MKITVIGSGYVGLVTGTGLANLGNDVLCLDVDRKKIAMLKKGRVPIYEPGLEELFSRNIREKRLSFTTDTGLAVRFAEIVIIAVGTPAGKDACADLSYVRMAAESIGRHMNAYKAIVTKSTVPVGTADMIKAVVRKSQKRKVAFDVVSNPEFLREGAAVRDFENPDRIIVGVESERARGIMEELYKSLARTGRPIMFTDIKSAELIKYASNSMLATRISFMNQLSALCERTGADIKEVARGMGLDSRIGPRFLQAGIGYGGSCFPKDVLALIGMLRKEKCDASLFEAVHRINEHQKLTVVRKLERLMSLRGKKIAVWGLAFKPKTDDVRQAPAIAIIRELLSRGAKVNACDPVAIGNARNELEGVMFHSDPYKAVAGCDALLIVTEWDLFRNLDKGRIKALLKNPVVIDGRNIYDPKEMRRAGFSYFGVGRASN